MKPTLVLALAAALCAARPASAQSDSGLKIPTIVWAAAVSADQATTYQFSSRYPDILHERNPLIRSLDTHPVWLVTAGTAIDATTVWAAHHFFGERHPRLVKIALYSAAAYRTYLAAYNIRMMHRAEQLR